MSGLSRTPGKRVWVNSPPRVRIPPAPPKQKSLHNVQAFFRLWFLGTSAKFQEVAPEKRGPTDQRTTAICERSPPL